MKSPCFSVFTPWGSRFFLLLLVLLAVVACPGDNGQDGQGSNTVPTSGVPTAVIQGLCPMAFPEKVVPASGRALTAISQAQRTVKKLSECPRSGTVC